MTVVSLRIVVGGIVDVVPVGAGVVVVAAMN